MAPYKKSDITVVENAFPLLDSNWLRIYNKRVINAQILLKSMVTYLSFVPVNYHSHTMHVDPLFNNPTQAHLKLLIKA
jgi:hypothetical protein